MNTLVELVGAAVLAVMFASWFQPIQVIKDHFGIREVRFSWVLDCPKCVGFWGGLIYFQDPFKAGIVALLAYSMSHLIDRMEHWYQK